MSVVDKATGNVFDDEISRLEAIQKQMEDDDRRMKEIQRVAPWDPLEFAQHGLGFQKLPSGAVLKRGGKDFFLSVRDDKGTGKPKLHLWIPGDNRNGTPTVRDETDSNSLKSLYYMLSKHDIANLTTEMKKQIESTYLKKILS